MQQVDDQIESWRKITDQLVVSKRVIAHELDEAQHALRRIRALCDTYWYTPPEGRDSVIKLIDMAAESVLLSGEGS